ncbi:MAG: glycosyltransferase family 4 protein [Bacilli bacterium]|nr:glycosyltransferase family 4 protein [Bacilli bacterium]
MKKCAIITPGFLPVPAVLGGAVEVLIEELVIANEKNPKFMIDLYTVENPKLKNIKYNYCRIIEIPLKSKRIYTMIKKAKHLLFRKILRNKEYLISEFGLVVKYKIKHKKYDYTIVENNAVVFNSLKMNKNMIYHLHNNLDDGRPEYIIRKIISNCICTLSVSKYLQREMNKILESEKNKVLYNCVDLDVFNYNNIDFKWQKAFKENHKINDDDFIFYFCGRITKEKGVMELIKAFTKIANSYDNVKLLIVGKGWFGKKELSNYEKQLYSISKSYTDKIIFTGFVDHNFIPNILSLANCVVIPSTWQEPFGVVALEAMAMQKAIIATKSGGLIEPLEGCSILINNDKRIVENLYNSMKKIITDDPLRHDLENLSYKKLLGTEEFNSKNYFTNFLKAIEGGQTNENKEFNKK